VRRDGLSTAVHCEFVDVDEETRNEIINYCFGVEKEEHRRNKLVVTR
jgi:c-di-GMP-binding flagellar brake protein YcgR